jgi:tetratricopeptide (TPR) repeat protein
MAKERRPSKSTKAKASGLLTSRGRPLAATRGAANHPSPAGAAPSPEPRRSTYIEAVALYERGLEALQRHDYQAAGERFESVLRQYPEEKELHERVRLYLNICQRQATRQTPEPRTVEERLFASTIAINGGRYDEAISQLHLVRDEDPDNDHALYMLAVAHAQRGEPAEAVAHLERAIAVNSENRALARTDPDLDSLRGDEAFRAVLEAPAGSRGASRRPLKTRPVR